MDRLWVDAPSEAQAKRLVELLDGFQTVVLNDGGRGSQVHIDLSGDAAELLIKLFEALSGWLSDDDLHACRVHFGDDRVYTLLQPTNGESSDPRNFLLERTIQLQHALDSRIVIEQAKGVIAVLIKIDVEEAFEVLRKAARSSGRTLESVSREVVRSHVVPATS
ncbi:MAG TPA: ANTAR domain-containing protein [Gaiellaceae bacterium]|nr:ANTAR domain-containing protein [Gaiellaceae bacterium]